MGPGWTDLAVLVAYALGVVSLGAVVARYRNSRLAAAKAEVAAAMDAQEAAQKTILDRLPDDDTASLTMDDRIDRLMASLRESQLLIDELQAELSARKLAVDRLWAEEEESRRLAALRAEEARAVRDLLTKTVASVHRELQQKFLEEQAELRRRLLTLQEQLDAAGRKGRRDQVLFFVLGALLSVPLDLLG